MRRILEPYVLTAVGILFPLYAIYWYATNISVGVIVATLSLSLLMGSAYSMFAHRAWTHRAWVPARLTNIVGLFIFTLMLTGPSMAWVAVHRKHHRYEDGPDDPHSPYHKSWFHVQFLPYFSNVNILRYAPDIIRQRDHMWFATYYWPINILWVVGLYLIDPWLLSFWISYTGFVLFKQHTINSLLHASPWWMFPINYKGGAANSLLHSLVFFHFDGESFHANHHADPTNWNFSRRWYEIDLVAVLIWTICKFNLGTLKKA